MTTRTAVGTDDHGGDPICAKCGLPLPIPESPSAPITCLGCGRTYRVESTIPVRVVELPPDPPEIETIP